MQNKKSKSHTILYNDVSKYFFFQNPTVLTEKALLSNF